MARKRVKAWREEAPKRSTFAGIRLAWRILRTAVAVAAILYVAGLFAARTEGFRDIVARRLEARLGLPVSIGSVSADWRYDLTLRSVATEGTREKQEAGVRAQRVRLGWSLADWFGGGGVGLREIDLDRCVITFARGEGGSWQPEQLAPLSDFLAKWLHVDLGAGGGQAADGVAPTAPKAPAREATRALQEARLRVALRRCEVTWWTGGEVPLAALEGVTLTATPVRLPNRSMTHYHLKLARAASAAGMAASNLTLELLDTGDQQIVLVLQADHTTGLAPTRGPGPARGRDAEAASQGAAGDAGGP